jgi:hypothetical protein
VFELVAIASAGPLRAGGAATLERNGMAPSAGPEGLCEGALEPLVRTPDDGMALAVATDPVAISCIGSDAVFPGGAGAVWADTLADLSHGNAGRARGSGMVPDGGAARTSSVSDTNASAANARLANMSRSAVI